MGLKSYMLVRVALDVGEDRWFGDELGMPEEKERGGAAQVSPEPGPEAQPGCRNRPKNVPGSRVREVPPDCRDKSKSIPGSRVREVLPDCWDKSESVPGSRTRGIWKVWGRLRGLGRREAGPAGERRGRWFRKRRTERLKEKEEAARREALLAEREERIRRTEASIKKLALEVTELAGEENPCYCVYDNNVRKALVRNGGHGLLLPVLWQSCFEWKEFADYSGRFWVEQLMPEAVLPHFVILGTADCIPELLEKYARGMKSLRWILAEADCTRELEEFVEDFYIEFGLAVSLQVLPEPKEFKRLRLVCALPSNILDFTGEPGIGTGGVADGSIWLDMQSVEEKRRRILGRGSGITYFSMKEKWKYVQRRCKSPVLP